MKLAVKNESILKYIFKIFYLFLFILKFTDVLFSHTLL